VEYERETYIAAPPPNPSPIGRGVECVTPLLVREVFKLSLSKLFPALPSFGGAGGGFRGFRG